MVTDSLAAAITLHGPLSPGAKDYLVQKKSGTTGPWQAIATLSGSSGSYTDTEVEIGRSYEYHVRRTPPAGRGSGFVYSGNSTSRKKTQTISAYTMGAD